MARETPEVTHEPDKASQARRTRLLLIVGAAAPCVLFLVGMIAWTVVNGLPDNGAGLLGGMLTVTGIAIIAGGYWLAERYWINPRK